MCVCVVAGVLHLCKPATNRHTPRPGAMVIAAKHHGDTETNLAMSAIYGDRESERGGNILQPNELKLQRVCVCAVSPHDKDVL